MGYAETRLLGDVQRLKRELLKSTERERQTRQGCMDLVQAMRSLLSCADDSNAAATATTRALVDEAEDLLSPDAE
jgi:hypothetical protein